jgi:hypothetical protein
MEKEITKVAIGAHVDVVWKDSPNDGPLSTYISFDEGSDDAIEDNGVDCFDVPDDKIFYFCSGENDLKSLMQDGVEEFKVVSYKIVYKEIESES